MPDAVINHTSLGWPYLDPDNYVAKLPDYTTELATKLENSDAAVADAANSATEAANSAADAAASAAAIPPLARGSESLPVSAVAKGAVAATVHITFPAGRFSTKPRCFFTINNSYRAAFLVPTIVSGGDQSGVDVTVYATDTMSAATLALDWLAVEV